MIMFQLLQVFLATPQETLLMEGIPNNHLGCGINPVNNGDKLPFPQLIFAGFLVAINRSKWIIPKKWVVYHPIDRFIINQLTNYSHKNI